MKPKKYTEDDLKKNSQDYEEVFQKLIKSKIGSFASKKLAELERRISKKDEEIRRYLNRNVNPCPLGSNIGREIPCEACTGYLRPSTIGRTKKKGYNIKGYIQIPFWKAKRVSDAHLCTIKKAMLERSLEQ